MEEKQNSAIASSLTSGIIVGIVLIVFSLLMYFLDVDPQSKIMWLSYLILAAGLWWAIISYRNKLPGGYLTYGKAFSAGFFTGLFASIILAIFTFIYVQYIDTTLIDKILANAEDKILNTQPNISDEDLDRALSMTRKFTNPSMMSIFSFVGNTILSTLFSLIIAIFAKREDNRLA